jgi:hypothetical protein
MWFEYIIRIDRSEFLLFVILFIFGLCTDIDGQGGMRLISGIIVVEEKGRVARVDKVMKYVPIITVVLHDTRKYTIQYICTP